LLIGKIIRSWNGPIHPLHGSNEAIAATGKSFDKVGSLSRIAQRVTKFANRRIQPVLEINVRAVGPEAGGQLLAGYHLARTLEQSLQNLKGKILDLYKTAAFEQFSRTEVHLEHAEM
jgi:hypothetical protein